ncbi:PfkB family carbohydrate kinase [Microbacterium sp. JB110]|uniref:PfkB family carbohydrate kinase n=1 Tax=Microbacterium sp. JB110 TaxID=2024477 RepID=UPI000DF14166|nr:PfkB family carbohydrate kinase [Microbacterium sp. JB110]RCS60119.1 hypothetical protein CIK77_12025 [Microbacterium sp. JB110]
MITALALSPALDVTYVVDRLQGIQRPREAVRVAGGKSLNAARGRGARRTRRLRRRRARAARGGTCGAPLAATASADRDDDGATPTRTCVSIFDAGAGELTEIYERPVAVSAAEADLVLDAALGAPGAAGDWFLLSGGLPQSLAPETVAGAVRRVHQAGGRIAIDTHGRALRAGAAAGPDLVKVNRAEAVELLGCAPDVPGDRLVSGLHGFVAGAGRSSCVVVTDGEDGAWGFDGGEVLRARRSGPVGAFPVGSGDSFLGGLMVAFEASFSLREALPLGAAAGVANAQLPGAARLDAAMARRLAAGIRVDTFSGSAAR